MVEAAGLAVIRSTSISGTPNRCPPSAGPFRMGCALEVDTINQVTCLAGNTSLHCRQIPRNMRGRSKSSW